MVTEVLMQGKSEVCIPSVFWLSAKFEINDWTFAFLISTTAYDGVNDMSTEYLGFDEHRVPGI